MTVSSGLSESQWVDLLDLIEIEKVIPMIGSRMSLVEADDGQVLPFDKAAAERLAKELGMEALPSGWRLNELYASVANKGGYGADTFHPKLKRVLRSLKPSLEPLRKIAGITNFHLFLSTAIDGYLVQAVNEVRGTTGETVTACSFAPGYPTPQRPLLSPTEVCIFQLLGSQETCPNWAIADEAVIEFVLGLHGEKYRPERLFDALRDRHVLAIGCHISDWLGRFFLRSLREGPLSAQAAGSVLVEDDQDSDDAFEQYLEAFGKKSYVVGGDPAAFVEELHRRWSERVGDQPAATPTLPSRPLDDEPSPAASGKVFISYSHADRNDAEALFDYLCAQGIDLWKDDRDDALAKGSNWDAEIRHRISDCSCFVPLISRNTSSVSESYFWDEWNQALKRRMQMDTNRRRFIFPVLCERDLPLPEQFNEFQWTVMSDAVERESLARSLREEQRSQRKALR